MFHKRTGQILATLSLLAVSALPIKAHANQSAAPEVPVSVQAVEAVNAAEHYFDGMRGETKAKLKEVKMLAVDVDRAAHRFQDRVAPMGSSMKKSLKAKLSGVSLVNSADHKFSVFGLILMMAFALVVLLLSLSNPTSRLGGRH